jgi:hypothetical protein
MTSRTEDEVGAKVEGSSWKNAYAVAARTADCEASGTAYSSRVRATLKLIGACFRVTCVGTILGKGHRDLAIVASQA